jgi:Ser/Thr protein kinase RdoA (MazF antagonist)
MDIGAHPATRATAQDAIRLARELYGLEAKACPLPSEYDDNFRLETGDGSFHNVIKIRPPLCFSDTDADLFVAALNEVLSEDPVRIA